MALNDELKKQQEKLRQLREDRFVNRVIKTAQEPIDRLFVKITGIFNTLVDYAKDNKKEIAEVKTVVKKINNKDVIEKVNVLEETIKKKDFRGPKGDPGKDGKSIKGKDGYTPKKGEDYFDGEDGKPGIDGKDGRSIKGDKGDSGEDGSDGSPDTPKEIRDKLETLRGEERLSAKYIKDLQRFVSTVYQGTKKFVGLVDTPNSYAEAEGKIVAVNSEGTGLEFITNDVGDITSVIAGDGLTGGGDSGAVTIDNSDKGSTAVSSHEDTYDHDLIATAIQEEADPIWESEKGDYTPTDELDELLDSRYVNVTGDAMTGPLNIAVPTATQSALVLQTTDDDTTENLFNAYKADGTTSLMALTADGRLGVGAGSPSARLTVKGVSDVSEDLFHIDDASNRIFELNTNPAGAGQMTFRDGSGQIGIIMSGAGGATFNELSNNADVRIEGGNDESLFFTKGLGDRIGIGTQAPSSRFHIVGRTDEIQQIVQANSTQTFNRLELRDSSGTANTYFDYKGNLTITPTGVGTNPLINTYGYTSNSIGVSLSPTINRTGTSYGIYSEQGFDPTGATSSFNGYLSITRLKDSSENVTTLRGFWIAPRTSASYTGTLTTSQGLFIEQSSAGFAGSVPVTSYGIYIDSQNSASGNSYSLYTREGLVEFGDELITRAGRIVNTTTVNAATYDLLESDDVLLVTYTSTGAVTSLTLPTAQTVDGRRITIKDAGGNATTNSITIDTEGTAKIEGQDTLVLNLDYESVTLICDGTNFFII